MGDFSETAEIAELRSVVRQIAGRYGGADFAEHGRRGEPQDALWKELGKAGFIGINVPAEYGGGGAGVTELAMVAEESAAAGCPLLLLLVSSAIGVEVLSRTAHPSSDRRGCLSRRRQTKVVFAITEPDAGSNSHRITTTAVRDGNDYLISGSKYYISGVDEAAAILTVARTGVDQATGQGRLCLFLVPTDAPG